MPQSEKILQVLLPAHNESGNIIPIYEEIVTILNNYDYRYSILFVDDGSTDDTLDQIKSLSKKDDRVKYIELARNFGHQNAIKAGLDHCSADVLIMMDCDLQHPTNLIDDMISHYKMGYDIVRTNRIDSEHETYLKNKTSRVFYKLLNYFSEVRLEPGSADFRLISGKAIDQLRSFNEFDLFYRGLIKWMGYKQISLAYNTARRLSGETKYSYRKMMSFGLQGFTSFSVTPLYFATYIGLFFAILSLLYIPYIFYALYEHIEVSGWASILASVVFFGSLNLIVLGIVGIYISKMFLQVKNRPHYIVRESNL